MNKAEKRQYCRDNHICLTCGGVNDSEYLNCDNCRAQIKIKKKEFIQYRIEHKMCIICGKAVDGDTQKCNACRVKFNSYERNRKNEKVKNNKCYKCGADTDGSSYCNECKKYHRDMRKIQYAKRIIKGVCGRCGGDLEDNSQFRYCLKCRQENRDYYYALQSNHICPNCKGKLFENEKICPKCKTKMIASIEKSRQELGEEYNKRRKEASRILNQNRKEQGICVRCGNREADVGYSTCTYCRVKRREYDRTRIKQTRLSRKTGECYFCGKPVYKNFKVCEKHYVKLVEMSNLPQTVEARQKNVLNNLIY